MRGLALHLELFRICALLLSHRRASGTPDQLIHAHRRKPAKMTQHALGKKGQDSCNITPSITRPGGQMTATRTAGQHYTSEVPAHLGAVTQELWQVGLSWCSVDTLESSGALPHFRFQLARIPVQSNAWCVTLSYCLLSTFRTVHLSDIKPELLQDFPKSLCTFSEEPPGQGSASPF